MSSLMASLVNVLPCRLMLEIESFENLGFFLVPFSGGLEFLFFDLYNILCLVSLGDSHRLF